MCVGDQAVGEKQSNVISLGSNLKKRNVNSPGDFNKLITIDIMVNILQIYHMHAYNKFISLQFSKT